MIIRFLIFFLLLTAWPAQAELIAVPPLAARVTDLTATLSDTSKSALEGRLADLEQRKGSQLAVLMLPTTGAETIEQYAIRVAEVWKLGRKEVDDGVLLVLAKTDRAVRIEVGYGLEGAIPDAVAKRVIEEVMIPHLKAGDFDGAVSAGVDSLIKLVDGEPLPTPENTSNGLSGATFDDLMPFAIIVVLVGGGVLKAIFGRLLGAGLTSGVAFIGVWMITGAFLLALLLAIVAFIFTLAGGSGGGSGGGSSGGGWSSGGGGFSGGGGGFGGGGASGRW